MKRKISFLFLSLMIMMLTPLNIYASNSKICLKTSNITGYTEGKGDTGYDYIYLGENIQEPIKWRVLSEKGNADGTEDILIDDDGKQMDNSAGMFIMTESLLCTSKTAYQALNYQDSTIKQWCDSVINGQDNNTKFTSLETDSLLKTEKDDVKVETEYVSFTDIEKELNGDKIFFLSPKEILNEEYGFINQESRIAKYNGSEKAWILRQAPAEVDPELLEMRKTAVVGNVGDISFGKYTVGYRIAANLNKENVVFSSAAEGGKGNFGKVEENNTHEWKLTLKDDYSFADGTSIDLTTIAPGKDIVITHKKLSELSADYTNVTVAISDNGGNIIYYGSVNVDVDAVESKLTVPADLPDGTYTLDIYGEDWNGDKFTDYATGTPFETELIVNSKPEEATTESTTEPSTKSTSTPKTTPGVKVGTAVTVGNLKYKITSVKANNPTVTITGMTNKKKTSVKIPATIKNNKVTYKVTVVANNAFKGNKKLKSVTIGKNVKSLGKNVFRGCKKLKKITVKTKVLKKVGANSLKGIHKKAVIKVPDKKKKVYKKLFKKKGQAKTVKIK